MLNQLDRFHYPYRFTKFASMASGQCWTISSILFMLVTGQLCRKQTAKSFWENGGSTCAHTPSFFIHGHLHGLDSCLLTQAWQRSMCDSSGSKSHLHSMSPVQALSLHCQALNFPPPHWKHTKTWLLFLTFCNTRHPSKQGSKYLARDYALAAARVAHTSLSWRNALLPLHDTVWYPALVTEG